MPVSGPSIFVTLEMVAAAVSKMKDCKAPGPSGIVAGMLKASSEVTAPLLCNLANCITAKKKVPSDWKERYIINLVKGKGDATDRGNYRGLKLVDHCIKVIERILEQVLRDTVDITEMQFGSMPGRGTTEAIFIVRHSKETSCQGQEFVSSIC